MAYVKTNWKTGDVVTSSKLNNMETGIYDANEASASAFAPNISNPQDGQVLVYDGTQQKWVNGAGGGDKGWSEEEQQLFSETITTSATAHGNNAQLAYDQTINQGTLNVTFNGTEYECEKTIIDGAFAYGDITQEGPDFSRYPFLIISSTINGTNLIYTESAGTYTVSADGYIIEVSESFEGAVQTASPTLPLLCVDGITTGYEILDALEKGKLMYFMYQGQYGIITEVDGNNLTYIPTISDITAQIKNGVFKLEYVIH